MSVLVVGSIALNTIKTPAEERADLLGGSASYAAVAASFFGHANMVGVVGDDFPGAHTALFRSRGIDLDGLKTVPGKTFRWSGEYHADLNTRTTRSTELNVFEQFDPVLPPAYAGSKIVLLANIAPKLQSRVLDQMKKPAFVVADTMNLWIDIARADLIALIGRVDMLILNDSEARQLVGKDNLIQAGKAIRALGPKFVAIKKGEHGCLLFGDGSFFSCPAYPLENVNDPTGAGDTFAGGLAGYLASRDDADITDEALRRAIVYGSILASFTCESFSLDRLGSLKMHEIEDRYDTFRKICHFDSI